MTALATDAIMCSARGHGEHGAIIRILTREAGLVGGYVRGGRSRRMRPILIAGNLVAVELRARSEDQLASATVELIASRAPLLDEPLPASAIDWATSLTATCLPEGQPFAPLYDALGGLLDAIAAAPSARGWAAALARYELLLLSALGFGLALDECVATGATSTLAFVSPKSGGAVSQAAATGMESRLFRLPTFLHGKESDPTLADVLDGLVITGHFIERTLLDRRGISIGEVRQRLIDRLERAVA